MKVLVTGNRVCSIIRKNIDHIKFAVDTAFSFIIFLHVVLVLFIIVYFVVCLVYFCVVL